MGSSVSCMWLRKESMSVTMYQWKLSTMEYEEKINEEKKKQNLQKPWNNSKSCSMHKQNTKGKKENRRNIEVIKAENFSKLMTDIKQEIQEAQLTPCRIKTKTSTSRHMQFELQKTKDREKIMKETREQKHLTYRGTKVRIIADFSSEITQARAWNEIFQVLKENNPPAQNSVSSEIILQ